MCDRSSRFRRDSRWQFAVTSQRRSGAMRGPDDRLLTLMQDARLRRYSRREIIRRGLMLGLSVPAINMLLAACGGSEAAAPTSPGGGQAPMESPAASPAGGAA